MAFNFDGEKYKNASLHQKEWGSKLISGFALAGDESILDLGCGDGVLSAQLAELVPDGRVLGIDASRGMIDEANKLSADNLTFRQMDIGEMDFVEEFDILYSNAALHWVKDHKRLLESSRKALKERGVIHWNFAGHGNCSHFYEIAMRVMNMPEFASSLVGFKWPWYLPTAEEYKELFAGIGFSEFDVSLENADRFFDSESTMIKWIDQPAIVPFLEHIADDSVKIKFRERVVDTMVDRFRQADGRCFETFRRLRVFGRK